MTEKLDNTGKSPLQSRTILFHTVLAGIQAALAGISAFEPFMEPLTYALVASGLGMVQSMGGVYLRFITQEPIK